MATIYCECDIHELKGPVCAIRLEIEESAYRQAVLNDYVVISKDCPRGPKSSYKLVYETETYAVYRETDISKVEPVTLEEAA